jgi:multiple sugar transport system ATP-binding protein
MAHVSLRDLTKAFEDTVAVADLNLDVADGEFVVLVGPSGSGKTTALRLVAGLERPTHGSIFIGERDVTDIPPKDRDIAMVFQNYALYPHMTVYENMAFGLQVRRFSKSEIGARVKEAAEILGIGPLLRRKPSQLSGGQRQRTALGRAIVRHPQAFLFDEPLSNLDASLRVEMRAELSQLQRRLGATILYVTHDQVEAMTMGQRIAVMNDGRLQQFAEPLEVYRRPANLFVASFIGSPAINLFEGELGVRDGGCVFRTGSFELNVPCGTTPPAGPAMLGVRPEDLRIADHGSFSAVVHVIEPVGSEMYIHLATGDERRVVARAPADTQVRVDERVGLEIPPDKVHLFRSDTGERIGP